MQVLFLQFTGNQFLAMTRINILTKNDTGNVNPVNRKSSWTNVYYEERGLVEWTVNIRPASYSRFVAVVRESSGGLTLSEVEVFGYGELSHIPIHIYMLTFIKCKKRLLRQWKYKT